MSVPLQTKATESPLQLFEELYRMLSLLYPGMRCGDLRPVPDALDIAVIDQGPYTTTLSLRRVFTDRWVPHLSMTVRACHDARVAEVVAYQECDRIPPPHRVQGDPRFHRDERRQVNRLLRQLLRARLAELSPALRDQSAAPREV